MRAHSVDRPLSFLWIPSPTSVSRQRRNIHRTPAVTHVCLSALRRLKHDAWNSGVGSLQDVFGLSIVLACIVDAHRAWTVSCRCPTSTPRQRIALSTAARATFCVRNLLSVAVQVRAYSGSTLIARVNCFVCGTCTVWVEDRLEATTDVSHDTRGSCDCHRPTAVARKPRIHAARRLA